ncbi:MAG: flagellar basal body P-ring protein FlgI [Planctomycetota bacterium]
MEREPTTHSGGQQLGRRIFLATLIVSLGGCQNLIQRGQSPDSVTSANPFSKKKIEGTRYVRDICGVFGLDYKLVHGIGLAVDLDGTGSAPIESGQRKYLVEALNKNRAIDDVQALIKSSDTELVIVQGKIPPGTQEGDSYDLEVVTMKSSDAESLENGMVLQTELRPIARLGRGMKRGGIAGLARGRILVNSMFDARDDAESNVHGVILGGGKAMEDRPIGLRIQSKKFDQTTSVLISNAINHRFTQDSRLGKDHVASPKTDRVIYLDVPSNYRHNLGRYVSVILEMSFQETREDRQKRMVNLVRDLSNPTTASAAAIQLEGLGVDGIPVLKKALKHQDYEVSFRAAESLAYSGITDGIETLRKVAETEPAFRWHAFAALVSLDVPESTEAIKSLLHVRSPETRYGAFQSLLVQSPTDPIVNGEWLGGDFYLHRVESDGEPMIHISRLKRPEIVVFNDAQSFKEMFLYVDSGLTVKANGNGTVTIKRYSAEFGDEVQTCSSRVTDVIEILGRIGVGYADQLKMLRKASDSKMLPGRLVVNATPKLGRTLARGENEPEPEKSKRFMSDSLPELFRTHNNVNENKSVGSSLAPDSDGSESATTTTSRLSKFKSWFTGSD